MKTEDFRFLIDCKKEFEFDFRGIKYSITYGSDSKGDYIAFLDSDDIWDTVNIVPKGCGYILYQCNRMSSLFKKVYDDGKIVYSDNNRFISRSISNPNSSWSNSFVNKIVEENPEIGHITFPYYHLQRQ